MNPKKAAELIFNKLAMARLIGKQNRTRAVGIIEFQLRAFNFANEGTTDETLGLRYTTPAGKKHTAPNNPPYDPEAHLKRRDKDEEELKGLLMDLIRKELKKLSKK